MRPPKIVFIGAGSMSFGTPTFRDVFTTPDLAGATLALVDVDERNLERMAGLARRMNTVTGLGVVIEATTDRCAALPGADFVITSIAVERCELWRRDFEVPRRHGVRHTLGENGGPGALFFTLRTVPIVMDIVRDMERRCPRALLLNFSNPESRIVLAVGRHSRIRCVGLCHGIFMARDAVAAVLGRPPAQVRVRGAGMNHYQWLLEVRDAATGEDLYPELRRREPGHDAAFLPYTRRMFHAFGLWPTCSDDHLGEYQGYGYEAGEHGYDFAGDAKDRARMADEIRRLASGEADVKAWLVPSGEKAVEAIVAVAKGRRTFLDAVITTNDGCLAGLPPDVAVEVPAVADAGGITPLRVGELPPGITALLNQQVGPQRMSVEAAIHGSKELALQALLCDPVTNSFAGAVKILDELWEANRRYIRPCG